MDGRKEGKEREGVAGRGRDRKRREGRIDGETEGRQWEGLVEGGQVGGLFAQDIPGTSGKKRLSKKVKKTGPTLQASQIPDDISRDQHTKQLS
jgi:hypothetical protein